ncbi:hypothetical protein D3C86_1726780 [compost metagenome]
MSILQQKREGNRHQQRTDILQRCHRHDVSAMDIFLLVEGAIGNRRHAQHIHRHGVKRHGEAKCARRHDLRQHGNGDAHKSKQ